MDYAYESLVNDICIDVANEELIKRLKDASKNTSELVDESKAVVKSWKQFNADIQKATKPADAIALCTKHMADLNAAAEMKSKLQNDYNRKMSAGEWAEIVVIFIGCLVPLLNLVVMIGSVAASLKIDELNRKLGQIGYAIDKRKKLTRELMQQLRRDKKTISDESKDIIMELVNTRHDDSNYTGSRTQNARQW